MTGSAQLSVPAAKRQPHQRITLRPGMTLRVIDARLGAEPDEDTVLLVEAG
jgi:hypothetical protein